ncbi:MAG: CRISPR-associated protein [Mariniphaga sp.]|nr:CRISPR-associated protein [Mariniphaga sp.]
MLINCSNHPVSLWDEKQKAAGKKYGQLYDLPFPAIDPNADTDAVALLAEQYEVKIRQLLALENTGDFAVHLMGELTFCFALVDRLQKAGITCLASTTRRETLENGDGSKISKFEFVKFREYATFTK